MRQAFLHKPTRDWISSALCGGLLRDFVRPAQKYRAADEIERECVTKNE